MQFDKQKIANDLMFEAKKATRMFPYNLMDKAGIPYKYVNPETFVNVLINCCTDRDLYVVLLRYTNDPKTGKTMRTYDEVAESIGRTRERVRQIITRVHVKLLSRRHLFTTVNIQDYKDLKYKNDVLRKQNETLLEIVPKKDILSTAPNEERNVLELELSVRSYNCLRRANIDTFEDLAKCTQYSLSRIRNLGSKSLIEIIEKAKQFGIDIPEGDVNDAFPVYWPYYSKSKDIVNDMVCKCKEVSSDNA